MRGARPELKVIEGGQDDHTTKSETVSELPGPPAVLPAEIADEWRCVVADLKERRLWKNSMAGMVTSYVLAQATLLRLEITIATEGESVAGAGGARKPHPGTGLLRSSRETVARLGAELGLSPTARSRKALQPREQLPLDLDDGWG